MFKGNMCCCSRQGLSVGPWNMGTIEGDGHIKEILKKRVISGSLVSLNLNMNSSNLSMYSTTDIFPYKETSSSPESTRKMVNITFVFQPFFQLTSMEIGSVLYQFVFQGYTPKEFSLAHQLCLGKSNFATLRYLIPLKLWVQVTTKKLRI